MNKNIFGTLAIFLSISLLSGCSIFSGSEKNADKEKTTVENKDVKLKQISKNIDFKVDSLAEEYSKQVNLQHLIGFQQLNKEQSASLIAMIGGKESQYRAVVEDELSKSDLKFDEVCLGLTGELCDFNNEIFKGTNLGIKVYGNVVKKDLTKKKQVTDISKVWSVNWINVSVDEGVKVISECSKNEDFVSCTDEKTDNPLSKAYAICSFKGKNNEQIESCLSAALKKPSTKDYAFDLGLITGYSIGYNVDNGNKFKDLFNRK